MQRETKKAREALFASSESEHSESEELEVIDDPLLEKGEEVQMDTEQQAAPQRKSYERKASESVY